VLKCSINNTKRYKISAFVFRYSITNTKRYKISAFGSANSNIGLELCHLYGKYLVTLKIVAVASFHDFLRVICTLFLSLLLFLLLSISVTKFLPPGLHFGAQLCPDSRRQPWSDLVVGDEGSYRHNSRTSIDVAMCILFTDYQQQLIAWADTSLYLLLLKSSVDCLTHLGCGCLPNRTRGPI